MKILNLREMKTDTSHTLSSLLGQYYQDRRKVKGVNNVEDLKNRLVQLENQIRNSKKLYQQKEQELQTIVSDLQENMHSDSSDDEKKIAEWLAELKLLKGVPLRYMIPLHHLLPNESIRFFKLDKQWTDRLVKGALSIGNNHSELDSWHDSDRIQVLSTKSDKHLHGIHTKTVSQHLFTHFPNQVRYRLLHDKINGLKQDSRNVEISGFLMRSDFVKKYAGVRIEALNASGERCACLSSEIIGEGIKLCLFEGVIQNVIFRENSDSLRYKIKDRKNCNSDGILDILKLSVAHQAKNSAEVAKELICVPEEFIFKIQTNLICSI